MVRYKTSETQFHQNNVRYERLRDVALRIRCVETGEKANFMKIMVVRQS